MSDEATTANAGLEELLKRRLMKTIWQRRTHRVGRGVPLLKAGSMTYQSTQKPLPLSGSRPNEMSTAPFTVSPFSPPITVWKMSGMLGGMGLPPGMF